MKYPELIKKIRHRIEKKAKALQIQKHCHALQNEIIGFKEYLKKNWSYLINKILPLIQKKLARSLKNFQQWVLKTIPKVKMRLRAWQKTSLLYYKKAVLGYKSLKLMLKLLMRLLKLKKTLGNIGFMIGQTLLKIFKSIWAFIQFASQKILNWIQVLSKKLKSKIQASIKMAKGFFTQKTPQLNQQVKNFGQGFKTGAGKPLKKFYQSAKKKLQKSAKFLGSCAFLIWKAVILADIHLCLGALKKIKIRWIVVFVKKMIRLTCRQVKILFFKTWALFSSILKRLIHFNILILRQLRKLLKFLLNYRVILPFFKKELMILGSFLSVFKVAKISLRQTRHTLKLAKFYLIWLFLFAGSIVERFLKFLRFYGKQIVIFLKKILALFRVVRLSVRIFKVTVAFFINIAGKLRNFIRSLYRSCVLPIAAVYRIAGLLFRLLFFKTWSYHQFRRQFECWKNELHRSLHRFLSFKVRFLRILILTNWLKKGYQLAIFLVMSLTVFSFSKASLDWKNEQEASHFANLPPKEQQKIEKNHFKFYVDITNTTLRNAAIPLLKDFELVLSKTDADGYISDKLENDYVALTVEGTAIAVHRNIGLNNLSKTQVADLISGKISDWSQLGLKPKKINLIHDAESYLKPKTYSDLVPTDKIFKILEENDGVIALLSIKNLIPTAKVLMVDYHYPSKSDIMLGKYPYGKYLVINLAESVAHERAKIAQKLSANTLRSVMAGGDLMWDRGVGAQLKKYGVNAIIEELIPYFKTGDISLVNLETSVSRRGERYNIDKGIFFRSDPKFLNILTDMRINLVSLANNHAFDYGMTAILDTIDYMDQKKIKVVGFGRDHSDVQTGIDYQFGDKKIRFIAYNTVYPNNVIATGYQPGIAMINPLTLDKEIKDAKKDADYLVILMHSGEEYSFYPETYKINLYRKMIDLGADIIVGSHPHVVQSFEFYKGKPIIYSVGNLIFDQYRFPKTRDEIVMELNFYNGRLTYLFPHYFNVNSDYKPVLVKNREIETLIARMNKLRDNIPMITRAQPVKNLKNNVPLYQAEIKKGEAAKQVSDKPEDIPEPAVTNKPAVDSEKLEEDQYREAEEKMPAIFSDEGKGENKSQY